MLSANTLTTLLGTSKLLLLRTYFHCGLSLIHWWTLQRINTENSNQIFPEKELRGHSPNLHIHILWAIYIFWQSICLFCCRKYVDRSWEYINRPQTHGCGNWDWGRPIPIKGTHKWDFRCSGTGIIFSTLENYQRHVSFYVQLELYSIWLVLSSARSLLLRECPFKP